MTDKKALYKSLKEQFDINSDTLCSFYVDDLKINLSDLLRDVYKFVRNPKVIAALTAYGPVSDVIRAKKKLKCVVFTCLGDKCRSFYNHRRNYILYYPASKSLVLTAHLFLHELIHILTRFSCANDDELEALFLLGDEEAQKTLHCRPFKRCLLASDKLYGLLSEDEFKRLEPLIDSFSPEEPYAFENYYKRFLVPTTRQMFKVDVSKKKTDFSDTDTFTAVSEILIDIGLSESEQTVEMISKRLEAVFSRHNAMSEEASIRLVDLDEVTTSSKDVILYSSKEYVDVWQIFASVYRGMFQADEPSCTYKNKCVLEYKIKNTCEDLGGSSLLLDVSVVSVSKEELSEYVERRLSSRRPFEVSFSNNDIEYEILYDGVFVDAKVEGLWRSFCMLGELKRDVLKTTVTAFSDVYTLSDFEMTSILDNFVQENTGSPIDQLTSVYLFDTDCVYTNILTVVKYYTEAKFFSDRPEMPSDVPFTSKKEFSAWLEEFDVAPLDFSSGSESASERVKRFQTNFTKHFSKRLGGFAIRGFAFENELGSVRAQLLKNKKSPTSNISLFVKKGIPFILTYVKDLDTSGELVVFYFDGERFAVFQSTAENIDVLGIEDSLSSGVLEFLDFTKISAPRANFRDFDKFVGVEDLLNSPVALFGEQLESNLLNIDESVYVNEIISGLVKSSNVLLRNVLGEGVQLYAVFKDDNLRFVYRNIHREAVEISDVYAWWLLAL